MNSGWFFGDSFTAGWGLDHHWAKKYVRWREDHFEEGSPLHTFKQWGYRYQDSTFTKLLCSHYRLTHKSFARPGATNEYIVNSVWKELSKMNGGDYVVIGTTRPLRIPYFNNHSKRMEFASLVLNPDTDELEIQAGKGVSEDFTNACLDYLVHVGVPNEQKYQEYYKDIYSDILTYLRNKGIRAAIVYDDMWGEVETIYDWTRNSKIYNEWKDFHWSPNGHREVYKMLVEVLEQNIDFLDRNKVLRYKKFGTLRYSSYI